MSRLYPAEHPLGSACLKVERANVHIHSLETAIRRSSRQPTVALSRKRELNIPSKIPGVIVEPTYIYEADIDPRVSLSWGLIVGDILSNLRASLDHIAWALATKHAVDQNTPLTDDQKRRVYFPLHITKVKRPFLGGLAKGDICLLLPQAHGVVESFQPYNRTNWPEVKLLGVLGQLTNEDKHRVVTPVLRDVGFRFTGNGQFMRTHLNQPDKLLFVVPESMRPHLKPEATFDVVLSVPFLSRLDTFRVSEFCLIHDFIRDDVIPEFAGFFP
jgi:hypothetical protein